jgi:hypothetical protein
MMQYEYCFAFPDNIDACFATEFDECKNFHKAGPATSANIAMAAEGDEVTLTHDKGSCCKFICRMVQTSGYKCFTKKNLGRDNPPAIIARPVGKTDVVLQFVSRNVVNKTWKLLAENKDGKKELLTFGDNDNINEVKVCVRDKFSSGGNDVLHIQEFVDVNGRRNALKFFYPGATKSDKKKVQPLKRPSAQKKISQWTKK